MPKAFLNCIKKKGARIRTISSKGKYFRVCYYKGKSYKGETRKKKKK